MLSRAFDHICMEKARYKFLIIIIYKFLIIISIIIILELQSKVFVFLKGHAIEFRP